MDRKSFGEFIRRRAAQIDKKESEVARDMGKAPSYISDYVTFKKAHIPNSEELAALAKALECTEAELIAAAGYTVDVPETLLVPWLDGNRLLTNEQIRLLNEIAKQFQPGDE